MSEINPPTKHVVEMDIFSQLADRHPILWEIKFPHVPKIDVAKIKAKVAKMSPAERKIVLKNARVLAANSQTVADTIAGME